MFYDFFVGAQITRPEVPNPDIDYGERGITSPFRTSLGHFFRHRKNNKQTWTAAI